MLSISLVFLQVLLGTNCTVEQPDYAHADRFFVGVAKVPAFFVDGRCKDVDGPSISVFADASTSRKIAEVKWGRLGDRSTNYCTPLVFEPAHVCPRGVLPVMEDGYEESVLTVVERKARWVRVRLDRGTGWVHLGERDEFVTYGALVAGRLAELTGAWDGRVYRAPGSGVRRLARSRKSVTVEDWRDVGGQLWFQVRILSESPCTTQTPREIAHGWIRAYSDKRQPTVLHFSRGC
jgi:hypothetical protein